MPAASNAAGSFLFGWLFGELASEPPEGWEAHKVSGP